MRNKILVIAAHPDDEILGVGGTILKHIDSGDKVFVCILTRAYEPAWNKEFIRNRILEQKKVDKLLSIAARYNLDFPTAKLNLYAHGEINKKLTVIIEKIKPIVVYTHFAYDAHQDHCISYKASVIATRPPNKIKLLCFETLSETEWGNEPFVPNVWNDINNFIDKKIKAFRIYSSEVRKYPHPRSPEGIKVLARKRGMEVGKKYCESFMLIRDIND